AEAVQGNSWQKFANPSAARGKTAFLKTSGDQGRDGLAWLAAIVQEEKSFLNNGTDFHTYKMQINTGKIPSSIEAWRDKHGTDAVIAIVWVKKDASA
ncbi:hypothetical protein EV360DRAFT_56232, partial [Lentinula raphanica]